MEQKQNIFKNKREQTASYLSISIDKHSIQLKSSQNIEEQAVRTEAFSFAENRLTNCSAEV